MNGVIGMENVLRISTECSYLGQKVLAGNSEAVKKLYGYIGVENPALIKTISLLQENLTAVEIENDVTGFYNHEFIYYWGMTCLGEQSNLIVKDLGTAETCFKKIKNFVPKVEARLAFIELLKSTVPAKNDINISRIDVLRKWAGKQDLFSRIILSKICFYEFLHEYEMDYSELPIKVLRLLELPCQKGHPVAIRFCKEVLAYTRTSTAMDMWLNEANIFADALYDYETPSNIQIWL